tara:strand:+ start:2129 stop:2782 length:654 start_codon:yes stop_codon:yes gene_type:complete
VQLLDFIFKLGVLFAVYEFLWAIFDISIKAVSVGRTRSTTEIYILRFIKYFFLVDVTFLFCFEQTPSGMPELSTFIFAGLILLTYFIGKLQKNKTKSAFFKIAGRGMPNTQNNFSFTAEAIIIGVSLMVFILFWFFPEFAINPIAEWFREKTIAMEKAPVFGFIFNIVGFFFLLTLIFKMVNTVLFFLNGGLKNNTSAGPEGNQLDSDDHFDDFEEL